jgi:dihydropteroate synthase
MGILNVTPDSFLEAHRHRDPNDAVARALELVAEGADLIDIGGESTRPGASAVPVKEELERVIPVLQRLIERVKVPISVDTRKAAVARAALSEGAAIINDVSALTFDPEMAPTVAGARCAVVLMHMRGTPATMVKQASYHNVVATVRRWLAVRARYAVAAGVAPSRIIIDPGFGFAKRPSDNLSVLRGLPRLAALGYPVLVGFSGKLFEGYERGAGEFERIARNAVAEAIAVMGGASIIRVHQPAPAKAAVRVVQAWAGRAIPAQPNHA